MFDFLTIPEINNKAAQNIFVLLFLLFDFFACDAYLIEKHPDENRKNIKLVDFFISRLRVFIPASTLIMTFHLFFIYEAEETAYANIFIHSLIITALCFYAGIGMARFFNAGAHLQMFFAFSSVFICDVEYLIADIKWLLSNPFTLVLALLLAIAIVIVLWLVIRKTKKNNKK